MTDHRTWPLAHCTLRDGAILINVYVTNVPIPRDGDTPANVVAWADRIVDAELVTRGLLRTTHQIVFALDLLQVERLCVVAPNTSLTWLRLLIERGFRFVWGSEYIRHARADHPGGGRYPASHERSPS